MVIALVAPEREIVCIDSVGKKTAFVTQAAGLLELKNVTVMHDRVEALTGTFDVVASRAFASLSDFVGATRHLLDRQGIWMALKGKAQEAELADLRNLTFHVETIVVPGLMAERCIVWIQSESKEASARL